VISSASSHKYGGNPKSLRSINARFVGSTGGAAGFFRDITLPPSSGLADCSPSYLIDRKGEVHNPPNTAFSLVFLLFLSVFRNPRSETCGPKNAVFNVFAQ
jgi:hypothetical protein